MPAATVICTVGTSLFNNLEHLQSQNETERDSLEAFRARAWQNLGEALAKLDPTSRLCGAEINSNESAFARGHALATARLVFLHSDTDDGNATALALKAYYGVRSAGPVETRVVQDLQDRDPRRFRTRGLRNLAKELCRALLEFGDHSCAINATGGYKAQVAVAVLLGQAMQVPVFYKHERFDEVIAFPPLPVALDINVWQRHSGLLFTLDRSRDPFPFDDAQDDYEEVLESLIERTSIDGRVYVELSAAGQVFHQAFKTRFRTVVASLLPPPVPQAHKLEPLLEDAGWPGEHPEVRAFLQAVTGEVPQVVRCATHYFNPNLVKPTWFRLSAKGVEGVFSQRGYTVKFRVESRASSREQQQALVAELNRWLDCR